MADLRALSGSGCWHRVRKTHRTANGVLFVRYLCGGKSRPQPRLEMADHRDVVYSKACSQCENLAAD